MGTIQIQIMIAKSVQINVYNAKVLLLIAQVAIWWGFLWITVASVWMVNIIQWQGASIVLILAKLAQFQQIIVRNVVKAHTELNKDHNAYVSQVIMILAHKFVRNVAFNAWHVLIQPNAKHVI